MPNKTVKLIASTGIVVFVLAGAIINVSPNRINSFIQAQDRDANNPFTFYIKVVDQDGDPLPVAHISLRVHRYNRDWDPNKGSGDRSANYNADCWSDKSGTAVFNGYGESINDIKVSCSGYDWLYDEDISGGATYGYWMGCMRFFDLTPAGKPFYIPDAARPAVFVLVKKREKVVRVSPAPGGSLTPRRIGGQPIILAPTWPRKPSIPGVRFEPPTTRPKTEDRTRQKRGQRQKNRTGAERGQVQLTGTGNCTCPLFFPRDDFAIEWMRRNEYVFDLGWIIDRHGFYQTPTRSADNLRSKTTYIRADATGVKVVNGSYEFDSPDLNQGIGAMANPMADVNINAPAISSWGLTAHADFRDLDYTTMWFWWNRVIGQEKAVAIGTQ